MRWVQLTIGVFNVPLEVLVERTGSDSVQGASNSTLRVPEFIEEIIATMRQMGESLRRHHFRYRLNGRYGDRRHL